MPHIRHLFIWLLTLRRLWQVTFFISIAAILYLATTSSNYPIPSSPNDKITHLIAFLELTLVTRMAWPRLSIFWYALSLLAFGFALEGAQASLPYRDFSLADLAANAIGIGLGALPWPGLRQARLADSQKTPGSL